MVKPHHPLSRGPGILSEALHTLVSQIPNSTEPAGTNPDERAKSLGKTAALKAAAISGSFTLPPGPLGMATVVPDLLAVWRVQQQLVADIAATYGKTNALTSETMVISLFKHGGVALTKPLFTRQGHEVVVQRIANRTLLQLLEKIAVRVAQRIAAKSVSRWLPVLGALGAGAYSYYDTTHVATNAIELFSQPLRIAAPADEAEEGKKSKSGAQSKASATGARRRTRSKAVAKANGSEPSPRQPAKRARKSGTRPRRRKSSE
jgi:hypothetical protein